MPTDAERWRFLADHQLTLHTDGGFNGYLVHWCRTGGPGEPPKFYPVSNGRTAEEAIATEDGSLVIRFVDGDRLEIWSGAYESWMLTANGQSLISVAGGGLAQWRPQAG